MPPLCSTRGILWKTGAITPLAKGRIDEAISIASSFCNTKESTFHKVFNQNGLALIEVRLGHPQEALHLVTEGIELLNRVLEPQEHLLHRSVLRYNRAQIYATLGDYEQALADYTAVIDMDPYYSEYYLDRGNIYRKQERNEEALQTTNARLLTAHRTRKHTIIVQGSSRCWGAKRKRW